MPERQDIDRILKSWPYDPNELGARIVRVKEGRRVVQMRIEMGLMQMEMEGRPDGTRPGGFDTYFDLLTAEAFKQGENFVLTEEQCAEADREFVQYYHRRICWLKLREHRRAVLDADHSLAFLDFVKAHSPDEEWTLSHEQYRPYILFHRAQAAALAALEEASDEHQGAESAVEMVTEGLERIRRFFTEHEAEDQFESNEMVTRLELLKDKLREHYHVGRTLAEQLSEAVASEQYELAAKLRDEIARRRGPDIS